MLAGHAAASGGKLHKIRDQFHPHLRLLEVARAGDTISSVVPVAF